MLGVEGEVVLEVLFGADGEVRVKRMLRGLGHGLDERAVEAASLINFLPARRDGKAVDIVATVRIQFQLA
jgi:TonB family protein